MGTASLVLGIIAFLWSLIPVCGYPALPAALVGLILGIVYLVQAKKRGDTHIGTAVSGVVLNILACVVLLIYTTVFLVVRDSSEAARDRFEALRDSLETKNDSAAAREIEQEFSKKDSAAHPFDMNDSTGESDSTNSK